jgi:thiosulfate dehydrogenase [quinone] large subunit
VLARELQTCTKEHGGLPASALDNPRREAQVTRSKTYILTAISVVLFIFLAWAFADGLFSLDNLFSGEYYSEYTIITYILLALIVGAGYLQAQRLPPEGVATPVTRETGTPGQTDDPTVWKLLMGNVYWSIFWMPIRFFVGLQWLQAGEHKVRDDAWMDGGMALKGFWERAVAIPEPPGRAAITYTWYRDFLQYMLDNEWYTWFAKLVAVGEFLIGLGLIVGALVGIAAFFGTLLNFSFMLAGTTSSNPVLFGLTVFLVLAWKVAGYWGLDRWLLPALGAPWNFGTLFQSDRDARPEPRDPAPA